jgi:hypothetical protein
MSLNADLKEFIELLNSRGVEYVIVGAHSVAFHGRPRYTGDLKILVKSSPENELVLRAPKSKTAGPLRARLLLIAVVSG